MGCHASFLKCFRESRMSVAGSGNILGGCSVLHAQDRLSNHFSGIWADDMDSEESVGLLVGQNLYGAFDVVIGLCSRVRQEWETALGVFYSGFLQFLFGFPNCRNLWGGVYDSRDGVIIHMAYLARKELNAGDAFFFGFVSKHGAIYAISDGKDAINVSLEVILNLYASSRIHLDADFLEYWILVLWLRD